MRRWARQLLAAFLVARLALAMLTVAHPTGGVLTDSLGYLALAQGLVLNGRYGVQPDGEADLLRPPMYAGFLAVAQSVWGFGTPRLAAAISLLQLTMSGLTAWLLVVLGRQLGRADAGLIAGWLYALSPNVALWSLTVMTETLFALMLLLVTLILLRRVYKIDPRWPVVAGVLLGVLAYLRPIALTLMPIWAIIAYWWQQKIAGKRRAALGAAGLLLSGALAAMPWAYRNWATYGEFTFSTATRKTLIAFNLAEVVAQGEGLSRNRAVASLDPDEGLLPLTLSVFSRYPGTFLKAQAIGVLRTALGSDVGTWGNVLGDDTWSGFGLLSGAFWGSLGDAIRGMLTNPDPTFRMRALLIAGAGAHSLLLIGLAALGIRPRAAQDLTGRFITVLAVATVLMLLITPGAAGQARFRIPAEPYLALLAGYGGMLVWERLLRRLRGRPRAVDAFEAGLAGPS